MKYFSTIRLGLIAALLAAPLAVLGKTYEAIKGESKLTYHLHHPMHEIEGTSSDFICTVDLNSDTAHSRIHVKASVESFRTGNSSRDSHALEIMQGFKYPFVEFTSDSVRHEEKGYRVFGNLNFHGVTRPMNFVVTPEYLNGKVCIKGGFVVLLSDYKLERPSLLFVSTDNDLHIDLNVLTVGP